MAILLNIVDFPSAIISLMTMDSDMFEILSCLETTTSIPQSQVHWGSVGYMIPQCLCGFIFPISDQDGKILLGLNCASLLYYNVKEQNFRKT